MGACGNFCRGNCFPRGSFSAGSDSTSPLPSPKSNLAQHSFGIWHLYPHFPHLWMGSAFYSIKGATEKPHCRGQWNFNRSRISKLITSPSSTSNCDMISACSAGPVRSSRTKDGNQDWCHLAPNRRPIGGLHIYLCKAVGFPHWPLWPQRWDTGPGLKADVKAVIPSSVLLEWHDSISWVRGPWPHLMGTPAEGATESGLELMSCCESAPSNPAGWELQEDKKYPWSQLC